MMLPAVVVFALAMLGWWLASIPGLLLGTVIGVWLDRRLGTDGWGAVRTRLLGSRKPANKPDATMVQFMLLGHLAKLNGRVLPAHIQQARIEMRRLGLEGYRYQAAIAAFNQGKSMELAGMRRGLQKGFSGLAAEQLLLSGWRLVWAQGRSSRQQYEVMKQCAGWLTVTTERLLQLEQQVKPATGSATGSMKVRLSERDRALQLLGLKPPVEDFALIRRAYRRLLSENHPDRLIGRGASAAQVQLANDKTRALHDAYSLLRQYYRAR